MSTNEHDHGGHEGFGHSHATSNKRRLIIAIVLVASVLGVEIVGAIMTGSLALLADAGHMASDLIGLLVALSATIIAARPATDRFSYGFARAEVFGALINGLILMGVALYVAFEAITRLVRGDEHSISGGLLLTVAIIGLVANFIALMVLRDSAKTSITMRGAYLEVLGDLLGSVAVIIAALVILTTGFFAADAIASLLIAAMIIPRAFLLLRDTVRVLSQETPAQTDVQAIREHVLSKPGVLDVHDVHVWAVTTGKHVFSAHVVVDDVVFETGQTDELLDQLGRCLNEHFDLDHSTLQLEPKRHAEHESTQHS